ncbi:hypothetical protein [Microbispora sp. NPDC049633]|uniref:hypothetical protein n=1 Tax=Microbispora sp. NPDC049633 TaxID=3154355 RepID=UPI003431499D
MNTTVHHTERTLTGAQIVWHSYVILPGFRDRTETWYPDEHRPWFENEADAKGWSEQFLQAKIALPQYERRRFHMTGHVECGIVVETSGRAVFEHLPMPFNQIYALVGGRWAWTTIGTRPTQ